MRGLLTCRITDCDSGIFGSLDGCVRQQTSQVAPQRAAGCVREGLGVPALPTGPAGEADGLYNRKVHQQLWTSSAQPLILAPQDGQPCSSRRFVSPYVAVLQSPAANGDQLTAQGGSGAAAAAAAAKAATNGVQSAPSPAAEHREPAAPGTPSATFEHRPGKAAAPPLNGTPAAAERVPPPGTAAPAAATADGDAAPQLHADAQVREAQQAVLSGKPFLAAQHGAPKPPCQAERWDTLQAIYKTQGGMVITDPDISARCSHCFTSLLQKLPCCTYLIWLPRSMQTLCALHFRRLCPGILWGMHAPW